MTTFSVFVTTAMTAATGIVFYMIGKRQMGRSMERGIKKPVLDFFPHVIHDGSLTGTEAMSDQQLTDWISKIRAIETRRHKTGSLSSADFDALPQLTAQAADYILETEFRSKLKPSDVGKIIIIDVNNRTFSLRDDMNSALLSLTKEDESNWCHLIKIERKMLSDGKLVSSSSNRH